MFVYILDAILNMVNNIAANVLGATPELESGKESEGTDPSYNLNLRFVTPCHSPCTKLYIFCVLVCVFLIDQNITAENN